MVRSLETCSAYEVSVYGCYDHGNTGGFHGKWNHKFENLLGSKHRKCLRFT